MDYFFLFAFYRICSMGCFSFRFSKLLAVYSYKKDCHEVFNRKCFQSLICFSVDKILHFYPYCTLQDIYKFFFQDQFGPGHLIGDVAIALQLLDDELRFMQDSSMPDIERTGWQGNFVRVNLRLVKEGVLPKGLFVQSFCDSANLSPFYSKDIWVKYWFAISHIINSSYPNFPYFERDSKYIKGCLLNGEYVLSHSKIFKTMYRPHYRIIDFSVFNKSLKPYLPGV